MRQLVASLPFLIVLVSACGSSSFLVIGCGPSSPQPAAPASAPAASTPATQPAPLGFGKHHHPIQTSNPEAQRMFDQGMAQAFGFNHEAAIRSFEGASQLDPKAAMPHWGRAWALGPNYNLDIDDPRAESAFVAINKARSLAAHGTEAERAYVDALAVRYSSDMKADRTALARKYSAAMRDLARRYPDDVDAATLYAESLMNLTPWKLWTLDGKPTAHTQQIVGILESALKRSPNHLGANHYYIHSVEASRDPGRGMPSAKRLETLAESSGHLLHMPAHIYARVGDHAAAAVANAAGAEADRKYLASAPVGDPPSQRFGGTSFYGMAYYAHNLHFLADSQMMQGRFGDARQAAARLAEHLNPHVAMMPMVESLVAMSVSVLMRFGRDADILALTAPPAERPVQVAWHHFARGVALARTGKVGEAAAERQSLATAIKSVPETALFGGGGLIDAHTVLNVAGFVLDARIAAARQDHTRAVQLWQRAVAAADLLPYDEPPVWFYPLRESLGAALLANNRAGEAQRVFKEDLERHPRNPRSLFGLQASQAKQGAEAEAVKVQREFEEAWKNADTKLSLEDF